MIQILRAVIITTEGVIVQDYAEVQDSLGVYIITDLEAERRHIAECQTLAGFKVKRVNLTYVTEEWCILYYISGGTYRDRRILSN